MSIRIFLDEEFEDGKRVKPPVVKRKRRKRKKCGRPPSRTKGKGYKKTALKDRDDSS